MIGFKFKDTHSSSLNIGARSIDRSVIPELRKKEFVVPGRHGTIEYDLATYEKRPITLEIGLVRNVSFAALRESARQVARWLSGKGRLIFDDEPDRAYQASVYSYVGIKQSVGVPAGLLSVTFECQPFAYSTSPSKHQFAATANTNYTLNNLGDREINFRSPQGSQFDITISGSFTSLSVSLNGKTLNYPEAVTAGAVAIKNVAMEVELNGENVLNKVTGDVDSFLTLAAGENVLSITGEGLNANVTVDFVAMFL